MFHTNITEKKTGVAMLASNKVDFRAKNNDQGQSLTFYDKTSAH
jgi:hypothetical protein